MVRINLVPDIRGCLRKLQMGKELVQYSFIFLGMTAVFCSVVVGWIVLR
jgi:hypothetical protein